MYRRNWNMDPRGRRNGHRGFRPGIVIPGIIGLIFFGWIIIAIVAAALGVGVMALGALCSGLLGIGGAIVSALASVLKGLPRILSAVVSSRSFVIGVMIGLVWYFRNHRRNRERAGKTHENGGTVDGSAVETEITEAPAYRTFGA